ncbi:hypothetical protein F5X96DRAFT_655762 [Biscogniauxia mediterranea]|nr:hypothetical protein F5X96DRAFT_655762 [Biscogniauxia mediterranea]
MRVFRSSRPCQNDILPQHFLPPRLTAVMQFSTFPKPQVVMVTSPAGSNVDYKSFGALGPKVSSMEKGEHQSHKTWRALVDKLEGADKEDRLEDLARELLRVAVKQLRDVKSGDRKSQVPEDIKQFLEGEQEAHKIDDCFRWHFLLEAVRKANNNNNNKELDTFLAIIKIILEPRPYLAFECLVDQQFAKHYENTCVLPKLHKLSKDKKTPFHVAAKLGIAKIIEVMISNGKKFYNIPQTRTPIRSLLQVVCESDPSSGNDETALELATKADDGYLETIEELLKVEKIETSPSNALIKCFNHALNEGWPKVVNKLVEYNPQSFITSNSIIRAIEKIDQPIKQRKMRNVNLEHQAAKHDREEIVKTLVRRAEKQDTFNIQVAKVIIERDLMTIWEAKPQNALTADLESCLLHLAVMYERPNFVELFVQHYPEAVNNECAVSVQDPVPSSMEKQFPLWYNNHSWDKARSDFSPRENPRNLERTRIRTAIVTKMVHHINNMERLSDIFHKSDEPFGDPCFDMSRFSSGTYRVSTFVDSLLHSGTGKLHSYEETLRYAEFPSLDMMVGDRETFKENSHFEHEHTEVFKVLEWLSKKGVKSIIKLKVPDRLVNPHDDQKMAELVETFEVEILDWKVLDLSISIFSEKVKNRIKELHLYSSGNRAVISHWFSQEGIQSLKNVSHAPILHCILVSRVNPSQNGIKMILHFTVGNRVNITNETILMIEMAYYSLKH